MRLDLPSITNLLWIGIQEKGHKLKFKEIVSWVPLPFLEYLIILKPLASLFQDLFKHRTTS